MSSEPESFLVRWSRRKRAAEREAERSADAAGPELPAAPPAAAGGGGVAADAPVAPPSPVGDPDATTAVPLPPIESLDGLRSDYQAFFQQPVDDELRRAALKKLFADPHFNQMDMLDVYVDDYTQFEPLPAALRLRLPSARGFLLDSEREALDAAETPGAAGGARETETATACEVGDLAAPAAGQVEDRPSAGSTSDETYPEQTPASNARADVTAADPSGEAKPTSSPAVSPGNA